MFCWAESNRCCCCDIGIIRKHGCLSSARTSCTVCVCDPCSVCSVTLFDILQANKAVYAGGAPRHNRITISSLGRNDTALMVSFSRIGFGYGTAASTLPLTQIALFTTGCSSSMIRSGDVSEPCGWTPADVSNFSE